MTRSNRLLISVCASIPWLLILMHLLVIVPRFKKLFDTYGLKLPFLTAWTLNLSDLLRTHLLAASAFVFVLMAVWWGVADAVCRKETRWGRRTICLLMLYSIPVAIFLLCWLGVGLSYNQLQDGLKR